MTNGSTLEDEFKEKVKAGKPGSDAYSFDTEQDFWRWEEAETLKKHYETLKKVELTKEILELRNEYMKAKILGPEWIDDATHVAVATVVRADAIVSWNFKHIVRLDKMKAYNQVNLMNGYGILTIISPKEVLIDED